MLAGEAVLQETKTLRDKKNPAELKDIRMSLRNIRNRREEKEAEKSLEIRVIQQMEGFYGNGGSLGKKSFYFYIFISRVFHTARVLFFKGHKVKNRQSRVSITCR